MNVPADLVGLVRLRAEAMPAKTAFRFVPDGPGGVESLTYEQLAQSSASFGAWLRTHACRGERVVIALPPGIGFVRAYFGCLQAGCVAVPVVAPSPRRAIGAFRAIVEDCAAKTVLLTHGLLESLAVAIAADPMLSSLHWLEIEAFESAPTSARSGLDPTATDPAMIQYTSGSMSTPKGVVVSHGNLLDNVATIQSALGITPDMHAVFWLPPYHDMGLVGGIVHTVHAGLTATLL